MNYAEAEVEGKIVYIRTKLSEDTKTILKSLRITKHYQSNYQSD